MHNQSLLDWVLTLPKQLRAAGYATALVFLSDNGRAFPGAKTTLYDEGIHAIFASHCFHETNQYYPMRALRTRTHTYILNLAHELEYPIAGDVAASPSWKATVAARANLGRRSLESYLRRPAEELYDVVPDPQQVVNLAISSAHRPMLLELRSRVGAWRAATHDPWLAGQTSPFEHSH